MKKIAMVYCYMGKWPEYFNLFLESCRYNPSIDFLFFTDCNIPENFPANIKFTPFTLNEFNLLASQKLNLKINVKKPYKLCDFKPTYGIIFEDNLKQYDFWGFGDIDVIFGDIRNIIHNRQLETYDIIASRKDFLPGHFCLLKNTNQINRTFEHSKDYKKVLQSQQHYSFGECNRIWEYLVNGGYSLDNITEIDSLTHVIQRLVNIGKIKTYFKTIVIEIFELQKRETWTLNWKKGKLIDLEDGKQYLYFHLVAYKDMGFKISKFKKNPNSFIITKEGILPDKLKETQREDLYQIYCRNNFPRTLIALSTNKSLTIDNNRQKKYFSYLDSFNLNITNLLKILPKAFKRKVREVYQLEKAKVEMQDAIFSFGYFDSDYKLNDSIELTQLDKDDNYYLHPDTKLIRTKWNWQNSGAEEIIKNIDLPPNEFRTLLAPNLFYIYEKQINEFCFIVLSNFTKANTLENAKSSIMSFFNTPSDSIGLKIIEDKIDQQFTELFFAGIILRKRKLLFL